MISNYTELRNTDWHCDASGFVGDFTAFAGPIRELKLRLAATPSRGKKIINQPTGISSFRKRVGIVVVEHRTAKLVVKATVFAEDESPKLIADRVTV